MNTRAGLAGLTLIAAVCATAFSEPSAAARNRSSCVTRGAKILVRQHGATVFDAPASYRDDQGHPYTAVTAFGCLSNRARRVSVGLDDDNASEYLRLPVLSGRFVAGAPTSCDGAGTVCQATVNVWDLRTGRRTQHLAPLATTTPDAEPRVASLVLGASGAVAWIANDQHIGVKSAEVHAVDTAGARLLDSGPGIDLTSLRLNGTLLTWTRQAAQRTAQLG